MTPLGSPIRQLQARKSRNKLTSGTTSVTDTSYSILVKLRFSLNTLDWSWVGPDSILGSPFLQVIEDEQFNSDVMSPIHEDFPLGLGKWIETDNHSKRWTGWNDLQDRGQMVRSREDDGEGTVVGADRSILFEPP